MNCADINLKLTFQHGEINGSKFDVLVEYNAVYYPVTGNSVTLPIVLPANIVIHCSGKTTQDTVLTPTGEILADKFVKIQSVHLDNFKLSKKWINNHMLTNAQGQNIFNYMGFNGHYHVELCKSNVFAQYYHCEQC